MKIKILLFAFTIILSFGCDQRYTANNIKKLQDDNLALKLENEDLKKEITKLKLELEQGSDVYAFSQLPQKTSSYKANIDILKVKNFIEKFPKSPLVKDASELLIELEEYKEKYPYKPIAREGTSLTREMPSHQRKVFENQFSRDGSHPTAVKVVKALMNDPKSFEHVNTTHQILEHSMIVNMAFRGRNSFNALVLQNVSIEVNENGKVLKIDGKEI